MYNFYYKRQSKNIHLIEICYPHQNCKNLKSFLLEKLGRKESDAILNHIILGECAYSQGSLIIVERPNEILNIKDSHKYVYIKKRVILKNSYLDYLLKYDFSNHKYKLKIIKNENGIKSDITDEFDEALEISKMLEELNIINFPFYINIFNDKVRIIDSLPATLEISNDEISLYSSRQPDTPLNELKSERYLIVKNDTQEAVGNIKFAFRETNISYAIDKSFQGNHYASKALKLMLELIKDNVNFQDTNLYVRIYKDNLASIKTAESCNLEKVDDYSFTQNYVVNPQKRLTVK